MLDQTASTKIFGQDVYTGETDSDGRRQGKGRCVYGAAVDTPEGVVSAAAAATTAAAGGGGNGGSYSGDWDGDEPHGQGERRYTPPGGAEGEGRRGGGGAKATRNEDEDDEDMAIVVTAFGPECPPLASYRGDFKRGVREGNGVCSFFAPAGAGAGAGHHDLAFCDTSGAGGGGSRAVHGPSGESPGLLMIPESYDGEWVGGRPLGRGVLSLRAAAAGRSGSTTTVGGGTTRRTSSHGSGGRGGGGASSIEGVWTKEEGLIHGREKLPGKGGVYEGQYRLGKREGHGRLDLPDGSEYEGERWLAFQYLVVCCASSNMMYMMYMHREIPIPGRYIYTQGRRELLFLSKCSARRHFHTVYIASIHSFF